MENKLKARLINVIKQDRLDVLTSMFKSCPEYVAEALLTVHESRFNRTGITVDRLLEWLKGQGHVVSTMVWDDMCTTEFVDGSLLLTNGGGGDMLAIEG